MTPKEKAEEIVNQMPYRQTFNRAEVVQMIVQSLPGTNPGALGTNPKKEH